MCLTEEEAQEERCPFNWVGGVGSSQCRASACRMAWRWAGYTSPSFRPESRPLLSPSELDPYHTVRVGYCGACGRPE